MKFKHTIPRIFEKCKKAFGVTWDSVVITYGDTVYSKFPISEDLKAHEGIHVKQQTEMGAEKWWDRYFVDKDFRLSQEVEAYKNQLKYLKDNCNRQYRKQVEKHIYKSLATNYGDACTSEEDAKKILQEEK